MDDKKMHQALLKRDADLRLGYDFLPGENYYPVCPNCGEDEEIIYEDGGYICIECGHSWEE